MIRFSSLTQFIFLVLLFACQQDENAVRGYPKITTLEVTEISSGGAMFNAEIVYPNLSEIIDHGFLWDVGNDISLEKSRHISLGKPLTKKFSRSIQSTLEVKLVYKVRAYVKTAQKLIYGKEVEFISLGSAGPKIFSVTPNSGLIGDTITIKGANYSNRFTDNRVFFNETSGEMLEVTDSTIRVVIPSVFEDELGIRVSVLNNLSPRTPYKLILPKIESISSLVTVCDSIIISGKNFEAKPRLLINNKSVPIISSTKERIVIFPNKKLDTPINLTVLAGGSPIIIENAFEQKLPTIESLSFKPNDTLYVIGKNFPTCLSLKTNSFPQHRIVHISPQLIKVIVPNCIEGQWGLFSEEASLYFSAKVPKYPKPEVVSLNPSSGTYNDYVTLSGANFIGGSQTTVNNFEVKVINSSQLQFRVSSPFPTDDIYIQVNNCGISADNSLRFDLNPPVISQILPTVVTDLDQIITIKGSNFFPEMNVLNKVIFGGQPVYDFISVTSNEIKIKASSFIRDFVTRKETVDVFVLTGGQNSNTMQLAIDFKSIWTRKKNFPGTPRDNAMGFSVNGKGYVGLGWNMPSNVYLKDIWEYDPINDSWTRKSDFPGDSRQLASVVVIGSRVYVGLGTKGSQKFTDWWEFDPATDSWSQKANFPGTERLDQVAFGIQSRCYVGTGSGGPLGQLVDFWEYNPSNNTWTRKADVPNDYRVFVTGFEFNGLGYCYSIDSQIKEWIYNASNDSWSSRVRENYTHYVEFQPILKFESFALLGWRDKWYPNANVWSVVPFDRAVQQTAYGCGFVIDEIGYIGLGSSEYGNTQFWSVDLR